MGTVQVVFAEDRWGSNHCAYLTGSDVSHVNGRGPVRKRSSSEVCLCMRNRELRNIRPSGAFFTGSEKVTWPEEALSGLTFFPVIFSRTFFLVVVVHVDLGCSLRRPIAIENYPLLFSYIIVFSTTSASYDHRIRPPPLFSYIRCSLRRPRPIAIGNYPLFIFIYYSVYVE